MGAGRSDQSLRTKTALYLNLDPKPIPDRGRDGLDQDRFEYAAKLREQQAEEFWNALQNSGARPGDYPPWVEIAWVYELLSEQALR